VFFPSISSLRSQRRWTEYLDALASLGFPQLLLSAFDLWDLPEDDRKKALELVRRLREKDSLVLLDSGAYESTWLRMDWPHARYAEVVRNVSVDLVFTHDVPSGRYHPPGRQSITELLRDSGLSDQATAPIVHCPSPEQFPREVAEVARLGPPIIAVPERELGATVSERATTIAAIRMALTTESLRTPLHILGTGDPISMLVYACHGADAFDGVEWSQFAINHEDAVFLPLQRFEWVKHQTPFGSDDVAVELRVFGHNLVFYRDWLERVRGVLISRNLDTVSAYLTDELRSQIEAEFART
jgi:hypothetical protein